MNESNLIVTYVKEIHYLKGVYAWTDKENWTSCRVEIKGTYKYNVPFQNVSDSSKTSYVINSKNS